MQFIRLLQEASLQRGVRVSILSGDAHVCGVGRLYSQPKKGDLRWVSGWLNGGTGAWAGGWGGSNVGGAQSTVWSGSTPSPNSAT